MDKALARRPADRVEAVERALALLQCFELPGEELSLALLAQRSALSKSTILRLSGSLIRRGFLHRNERAAFMLGPELKRLGRLSVGITLAEIIRPVLRTLVEASHETASFYVRDGDERICLLRRNSSRSARHHLEEGTRHPLGIGAAGRVLCAADAEPADKVRMERDGTAVSLGSRDPELAAIAVPVIGPQGVLAGALSISGLIGRFPPETIDRHRTLLLEQAAALRHKLPPRAD